MRHPFGSLPGTMRRLSGPLGGAHALDLRQQAATLRGRHPLRAQLPGIGQLAPHSAAFGQLVEAGLLAQPVPVRALAATPRGHPSGRCRALRFHSDRIPRFRQGNRSNGPCRPAIRREIADGGCDERQKSQTSQKEAGAPARSECARARRCRGQRGARRPGSACRHAGGWKSREPRCRSGKGALGGGWRACSRGRGRAGRDPTSPTAAEGQRVRRRHRRRASGNAGRRNRQGRNRDPEGRRRT